MTDSTFFKKNGYLVIPNFIEENFFKFIKQYFYLRIMSGKAELSDHQAPFGYSFYGDPLMETPDYIKKEMNWIAIKIDQNVRFRQRLLWEMKEI